MHRGLILLTFVLLSASCSQIFGEPGDNRTYYLIERPDDIQIEKFSKSRPESLVIRPIRASAFINSYKIIYSNQGSTRSSYQLAQWTEPPPRRLSAVLESVLLSQGGFSSITPFTVSAAGDLELHVELLDFYHDATTRPGQGVVEISAEVVRRSERKIIARTKIRTTRELESFDSAGAVEALTEASYQGFIELGQWLYTEVSLEGSNKEMGESSRY